MIFIELVTTNDFFRKDNRVINKWLLLTNYINYTKVSYNNSNSMITLAIDIDNDHKSNYHNILKDKIAQQRKEEVSNVKFKEESW